MGKNNNEIANGICKVAPSNFILDRVYSHKAAVGSAIFGGLIGIFISAGVEQGVVANYLTRPENAGKLQDLFNQTGFDSTQELAHYLIYNSEIGHALFTSCGARLYCAEVSAGIVGTTALACFSLYAGLPPLYKKITARKERKAEQKRKISAQESTQSACVSEKTENTCEQTESASEIASEEQLQK